MKLAAHDQAVAVHRRLMADPQTSGRIAKRFALAWGLIPEPRPATPAPRPLFDDFLPATPAPAATAPRQHWGTERRGNRFGKAS